MSKVSESVVSCSHLCVSVQTRLQNTTNLTIQISFIKECLMFLSSRSVLSENIDIVCQKVLDQLLLHDLNDVVERGSLRDVSSGFDHQSILNRPCLFQILSFVDIGTPRQNQETDEDIEVEMPSAAAMRSTVGVPNNLNICVKAQSSHKLSENVRWTLTDGCDQVFALEVDKCQVFRAIDHDHIAGTKILVHDIRVTRGILLLFNSKILVLGGRSPAKGSSIVATTPAVNPINQADIIQSTIFPTQTNILSESILTSKCTTSIVESGDDVENMEPFVYLSSLNIVNCAPSRFFSLKVLISCVEMFDDTALLLHLRVCDGRHSFSAVVAHTLLELWMGCSVSDLKRHKQVNIGVYEKILSDLEAALVTFQGIATVELDTSIPHLVMHSLSPIVSVDHLSTMVARVDKLLSADHA